MISIRATGDGKGFGHVKTIFWEDFLGRKLTNVFDEAMALSFKSNIVATTSISENSPTELFCSVASILGRVSESDRTLFTIVSTFV